MKKFAVFMVIVALLLAGCATQAPVPVETPLAESPDIEAIVQQSVDEAMAQYEAEQKAKDAEIEELKVQLEAIASQIEEEAPPPEESTAEETPSVSASSQPLEPESSEAEQPDPEPEEPVRSQSSTPSSPYDGFDLKNLYPSFVFDEAYREEETSSPEESYEDETEEEITSGESLEDEALEVIRLTNIERENRGLEPLKVDDDLMALAQIRAEEVSVKYSHERPDGTRVVKEHPGYGENVGAKASADKQVTSWMSSEGHCANILRERFHRIGVGCYQTTGGSHYWVQVFAP